MANFNNIKHEIDQNVNTNGVQAITGAILNRTLKDMIDEVDAKKQDTLVAGSGISISGNVISATGGGSGSEYYAGEGINIDSENVISTDFDEVQEKLVSGENIRTVNGEPLLGSGDIQIQGTNYSAGDGISIDAGEVISVEPSDFAGFGLTIDAASDLSVYSYDLAGNGLRVDSTTNGLEIDPSVVATQSDLAGKQDTLAAGANIQISGPGPTVISATDTTYSAGQGLNLNGTTFSVKAGSGLGFDANGNLINTGGGGGGTTYTAGNGIDISAQDVISVDASDLAGAGLTVDQNGALEVNIGSSLFEQGGVINVDATYLAGTGLEPNGSGGIQVSYGDGLKLGINNELKAKLGSGLQFDANGAIETTGGGGTTYTAGQGINIDQNNEISVDNNYLDGEYLSLNGGVLRDTTGQPGTVLNIQSPLGGGGGNIIYNVSTNNGADITLGSSGYDQTTIQNDYIRVLNATSGKQLEISSEGLGDGSTYHASLPTLTQNETLAVVSDLAGKQDTLTAGSGISIQNNVISATGGGGGSYTAGSGIDITNDVISVDTTTIQGKLTAGSNIQISGNTISATDTNTTYSAGSGLSLNGTTFSADTTVLQEKLTAGSNITIQGNVISATGGGGGTSFTPGNALELDQNDNLNVLYGSGLTVNGNNELEVDPSSITGFLPLTGGTLQNSSSEPDTTLELTSPGNGDCNIVAYANEIDSETYLNLNSSSISEREPGLFASSSDLMLSSGGQTGLDLFASASYAEDNGTYTLDEFYSSASVYAPDGAAEIILETNSTSLSDPGNETREARLAISDDRGSIELNPTGFSDGTYSLSFPTLSQDETIATLSDIPSASSLAGDGLQNDGNGALEVKLGSGLQFDANGAIETTGGGGGSSYTAGTGIDITNNTISVDNTIATKAELSGYLPLTGGLLKDTAVGATETLLDVQAPDSTSALSFSADTLAAMIQMSADRDDANVADGTTYGTNFDNSGDVDILVKTINPLDPTDISTTTYTQTFQQKSGTIALLSDISGGGTSYTAGTGISISAQNVISNSAPDPGFWVAGSGTNSIMAFNATSATGPDSVAIGYHASAVANNACAFGANSSARANGAVAVGGYVNSSYGIAGPGAMINGGTQGYGVAFGYNATVDNSWGVAIGEGTYSKMSNEFAIGVYNKYYNSNTTSERVAFSIGNGTSDFNRSNAFEIKANNDIYVVGVGGFTGANASSASTLQTVISGKQDTLTAGTGISISGNVISATGGGGGGLWTSGTGTDSLVAPGTVSSSLSQDPASGNGAISCGYDTNADGAFSFAQGGQSSASGDYSFAANNSTAAGNYSAAFGAAGANGMNSFAAVSGSADANYSVALAGGQVVYDDSDPNDIKNAQYGVAIGDGSVVQGEYGLAMSGGAAEGSHSVAIGGAASGSHSVAIGDAASAVEMYSTAFAGSGASGNYSFAASTGQADGHYSSAFGGGNAQGEGSLASGFSTSAHGYCSAALGYALSTYSQADGALNTDPNAGEVALGRYNYSEQGIVFTVGCGYLDETDPDNPTEVRQNAVAIDSTGKIYLKGLGGYTGTSTSGCTDLVSFLSNL